MRIFPAFFLFILACQQPAQSTDEQLQKIDTVRFGNFYGTDFWEDVASLSILNSDGTHLMKLFNDSTHLAKIDIGQLSNLKPELVSTNPNIEVTRIDDNLFELIVNRVTTEKDGYDARLALLSTFEQDGYVISKRDTTTNKETFSDFDIFFVS